MCRDWRRGAGKTLAPCICRAQAWNRPSTGLPIPHVPRSTEGIISHIQKLLILGVLRPCQLAWNTPLSPVKKPNSNNYHPVQDLCKVNHRVMDIPPTAPNPYTLLKSLPPDLKSYSVLDRKDGFFSLLLGSKMQKYFSFEWHDPERGINGQLTWNSLP
jgi:hypothetical protein